MENTNSLATTIMGLLTAALMYTAVGLVAGFIYSGTAPALGLPGLGLLTLVGLWWLWFLLFAPVVIFFVSTLKATAATPANTLKRKSSLSKDE